MQLVPSAYLPVGHVATHAPLSNKGLDPAASHTVQLAEPPAEHSLQEEWQPVHVATEPTLSTYSFDAHSATHSPLERKGALAFEHVRHWLEAGPVQVPHVALHASQTIDGLAYFPSGVQSETHVLLATSEKGCVALQLVHCVALGPEHSAQLESHATHVSAALLEPPEHVKPDSMTQLALQPSRASMLPSSHASPPTRLPSPQMGVHASFDVNVPPVQL